MMARAVKGNPIDTQIKPLQSFVNGHDTYQQMSEQKLDILLSNSAAEDMMLMKSVATQNSSQTRISSSRSSSRASSGHRAPLLNGAGDHITQKTLTPTKQVSLVAVKRKNDRCTETFSDGLDKGDRVTSHLSQTVASSTSSPVSSVVTGENDATSSGTLQKRQSKSKLTGSGKDGEDEEDESSEEEEQEEGKTRKAPNQLLIEFVTSLMTDDYVTAKKLCEMILIYEPTNKEALQFQPLISEKIQLDEERENEESDDDTDSDDNSDDDDSDSSNSSTSDQDQEEPKAKQTVSEKSHCCNGKEGT